MLYLVYAKHNNLNAYEFTVGLRNAKDQASMRNGDFWKGEIEKCAKVYCTEEYSEIAEAYEKAGIEVGTLGETHVEKPTDVETPIVEVQASAETPKIDGRSKQARQAREAK